jgi:hypothetical protein
MSGLGFGEALGAGLAFVLVFGLVLVGLLVFLTVTTVLYGLSVDARATGVGIAVAIGAGVVLDVAGGPAEIVVASLPAGFLIGAGLAHYPRESGRRRFFQGSLGTFVLTLSAGLTLVSAALVWFVQLAFFQAEVVSVLLEIPGTTIQLVVLTGVAAFTGWHVLQTVSPGDDARPAGSA